VYTYNSDNEVLSVLFQTWTGTNWSDDQLHSYTYDSNNYLTNDIFQSWNSSSASWDNIAQNNYTNDANGNQLTAIDQNWNASTSVWYNFYKFTYAWEKVTGVAFIPNDIVSVKTFPNPFSKSFTMSYSISQSAQVTITLNDVCGRQIAVVQSKQEMPGEHMASYSNAALPNGIYFYSIRAGNKAFNGKLVKTN
jgi:hypothetical protein